MLFLAGLLTDLNSKMPSHTAFSYSGCNIACRWRGRWRITAAGTVADFHGIPFLKHKSYL